MKMIVLNLRALLLLTSLYASSILLTAHSAESKLGESTADPRPAPDADPVPISLTVVPSVVLVSGGGGQSAASPAVPPTGIALVVWAFGGVHALMAATAPENTITVDVLNGPFAGTATVEATGCPHVKDRDILGCGWKAFAEHTTTKALEEAGIEVATISAGPGARTGDVVVKFLEANGGTMHDYSVSNVPLTLARNGGVQQISFDGKTKEGVRMRVTATIVQVDEF